MSGEGIYRPRRLRINSSIRDLVRETEVNVKDLIYPIFVKHGKETKEMVPSMPGVYRFSIDQLIEEASEVSHLGIPAILLFGIPNQKDELGSEAYHPNGIIQQAIRCLKEAVPSLLIITDVCMCEYTNHGHCGLVENNQIVNDPSRELIAQIALSHAQAGADIVAPSDMMDGRVKVIRNLLDDKGLLNISILAYSAKYASAFYGPFREAAGSTPQFGDRKSYQMDPANSDEALREIELDIEEGADIIMIKPALSYLDIIQRARETFRVPIVSYQVSGEYAMIKAAGKMGWLDEKRVVMETITSIKRAGADGIITYFAKDIARWLIAR
jgi:porphobilinogen synthase